MVCPWEREWKPQLFEGPGGGVTSALTLISPAGGGVGHRAGWPRAWGSGLTVQTLEFKSTSLSGPPFTQRGVDKMSQTPVCSVVSSDF